MTMRKPTEKQQQALDCLEGARREGMTLSAYTRSRGLEVREIYDAIAALRRRGALPAAVAKTRKRSRFVAVRVQGLPERSAALCRVLIGGYAVIECREWPTAEWLAKLLAERGGAAT